MINYRIFRIAFAMLAALPATAAPFLIESSETGCRFGYAVEEPTSILPDSLNPNGQIFVWPDLGTIATEDVLQPVRILFVAVPHGTQPSLRIESVKSGALRYGLAARPDGLEPSRSAPLTEWARITGVQDWRGFRLARIEIAVQRGDLSSSELLEQIQLQVRFLGTPAPNASHSREERALAASAINGAQAARWWKLDRPARAFDEATTAWPDFDLYKLAATESGLHAVTGSWLASRGANLLGRSINSVKMYGNGGKLLNKLPSQSEDDQLIENAILVVDVAENGVFDAEDSVKFYGTGLKGYDYTNDTHMANWAHQSPYSIENAYWIGSDPSATDGLRMGTLAASGGTEVTTTTGRVYSDNDVFIFDGGLQAESGLVWYSTTIDIGQERSFTFVLEQATGGPGKIRIRTRTDSNHSYNLDIYLNDERLIQGGNSEILTADVPAGVIQSGTNLVRIVNRSTTKWHYLNYIEIEYQRLINASSGTMEILAPADANGYFSYMVDGLGNDGYILDVTDPLHPRHRRGNAFSDSSSSANPRRYFALRPDRLLTPRFKGVSSAQQLDYARLRDPGMEAGIIIITHDDWYDVLEPMLDFHRDYVEEPLTAVRVKVGDIFNEFGWGNYDPVAIRNFLRYAHDNWRGASGTAEPPKYALFVGVGDYDYRNLIDGTDQNWMPPWNYFWICSDDFYVDFNDDSSDLLDMMSGRWPAENEQEVEAIVNKTILYAATPLYGPWKNTATFVADDEWKSGSCNEYFHSTESETLINQVLPDYFTFRKLYQIFYPFRTSATTSLKPDGTRDLIETINRGTLLVNFKGHGNEHVWTDEQLFVMDRDNGLLDNLRRWPLFVAATCTWGGYDRPGQRCYPELLLGHPSDGAVACVAATRFTFVGQNQELSRQFYEELFRQGQDRRASFGEALRIVKPLRDRNTLYHVLGNPVLRLATPEFYAYVSERDDSLQALALFHLSGYVSKDAPPENQVIFDDASKTRAALDEDPVVWSDFQGVVEARVFDSEDSATYYWCGDLSRTPFVYGLPGNAIFRGLASVVDGRFDVTFRVPRDIKYGGNNAKVSLYFYGKSDSEADSADGIGIEQPLRIASAAAAEVDSMPPQIGLWLEAESFRPGDQVSRSPLLHVDLSDESGLNLSGAVGHRVTVRIDDAASEDLTTFFNYELDSYTSGVLEKTIGPLSIGEHRLVVEAWDSFNNLNQESVTFVVGGEGEGGYAIHDVYNWPNPMTDKTCFTYSLTQQGTRSVSVKIFTLTGKLVYEINGLGTRQLYNSNADRPWHGRDREGHSLANGVYFYKIKAEHEQGHSAEATGKLVILR